jgi:carbon monoxide dehydrogenase subunit G
MDLNHEFTVAVPVADAWRILTDLERIAPCLPGAQLQEVEGDTYRGVVKIKVGPIQAQFKGQASFLEQDHVAHKAVLKGEGRDTGGKGNASALITAEMNAVDANSTAVKVTTDLSITGKVAQFGRGAMADISDKLLGQFVENLNQMIADGASLPASPSETVASSNVSDAEPASAPSSSAEPTSTSAQDASQAAASGVRKIDAPEAEALDLLSVGGSTIAKMALPVVAIAAVVIWFIVK